MPKRLFFTAVCLIVVWGCAHQDDVIILDQRLARMEKLGHELDRKTSKLEDDYEAMLAQDRRSSKALERDNAALQEEISKSDSKHEQENQKLRAQYAGINANIVELRDDLQAVRGNLDETSFTFNQRLDTNEQLGRNIQTKIEKMAQDLGKLETRVQYIEQYLNLKEETVGSRLPPETGGGEKKLSADDLYASSKQSFDQGDFETAGAGFAKIIKEFPKSQDADNAQFWIGEIYYREKWYEKAILEYQKVIENYPKGNKVPAALLKQGFAFLSLGDKANARLILKELAKKYPQTNEGKIAVQKLKEIP